jgi:hypothetical protein
LLQATECEVHLPVGHVVRDSRIVSAERSSGKLVERKFFEWRSPLRQHGDAAAGNLYDPALDEGLERRIGIWNRGVLLEAQV